MWNISGLSSASIGTTGANISIGTAFYRFQARYLAKFSEDTELRLTAAVGKDAKQPDAKPDPDQKKDGKKDKDEEQEGVPPISFSDVANRWGFTFDYLPHIGVQDGIHYAAGCQGSGVAMASWLGHNIA